MSVSFDRQGGTLGRAPENSFILPDPEQYISSVHARIYYENGVYYFEDKSTNGTYIANRNMEIHHKTVPLADGDRLHIGEFDILINIVEQDDDGDAPSFGFDRGRVDGAKNDRILGPAIDDAEKPSRPESNAPIGDPSLIYESMTPPRVVRPPDGPPTIPENLGIDGFFDPSSDTPKPIGDTEFPEIPPVTVNNKDERVPEDLFTGPPVVDTQADPDAVRNAEARNRQPGEPADSVPEATALKPDPQRSRQAEVELFNIFLDAAGIKDERFIDREEIPDLMRTIGIVLRDMIDGLMTILRGRAELKSQARVSVTTLSAVDNNPLKFSPNANEALKILLKKDHPGYVSAVEAIHEGCSDIMYHQLALTAGIQAAVGELLRRFDPQHFTKKYEEGIVFQKKAKSWDAYCAAYNRIVDEAHEEIFGEAFHRAYEKQMSKLRYSRKKK